MKFRIALIAAAVVAASASAAGAAPATATATATATIVAPATVVNQRALQFGTLAKPTTGTSTFTVASTSAASQTPAETGGGDGFVPLANQAFAAQFRVTAAAGTTYTVDTNSLSFTNQAGNLGNVGTESPVPDTGSVGTVPAGGVQDLFIGGHVDVTSSTAIQTYNGTLTLTLNFQ
jgi:hypothetical protein